MFNLIYRDGAPENAGHYEGFQKDAKATVMSVGELVSVTNGIARKYANGKPYGVVARASGKDEEEVAVLRITDDMIFSATGTATAAIAPENLIGYCAKLTHNGVNYELISVETGYAFEITEVVSCETNDDGTVSGRAVLNGRFVNLG